MSFGLGKNTVTFIQTKSYSFINIRKDILLLVTLEMDVCLINYKYLRRKKALYLDKITSACIKLKRASVKISNWPLNFIA